MTSARDLYQEVILEHNKKPRNYGALSDANRRAEGHNPVCGDQLVLTLDVQDEQIARIAFEGHSCAICKASASMMTAVVKGKSVTQAEELIGEFRAMTTGTLDVDATPHHLGRLTVFRGIAGLPTRVKCAVLPWHTLHAAFRQQAEVTTEHEGAFGGTP